MIAVKYLRPQLLFSEIKQMIQKGHNIIGWRQYLASDVFRTVHYQLYPHLSIAEGTNRMLWSRLNSKPEKLYIHPPIVSPPFISVNMPAFAASREWIRLLKDAGQSAHQDYAGFPGGFEEDD